MAADRAGRILLVDDDPDFLAICGRILRGAGHEVVEAHASGEALEAAAAAAPDLVITDLMMERMDAGFTFVQRLRACPGLEAVPVIVVSAIARQRGYDFVPRGEGERERMGVAAFLEKPVEPAALLDAVRKLLPAR